jgi:phosphate transport system substrate-binding protein
MKASEFKRCTENGVDAVTEVLLGYDGLSVAHAAGAPEMELTKAQLYQALAAQVPVDGEIVDNPYQNWSEIDPSLPDQPIQVFGPPPTSGTRDAFVELAMDGGCGGFEEIKMLEGDAHAAACRTIREDGAFVEAGENDNLIVQKLQANPAAFGIFGFSFLDQNMDVLQGSRIEGVPPAFEDIADGNYPISRSLYFYIKNAHVGVVPGLKEYVEEFTSDAASGEDGYLADKGLIPLPDDARAEVRDQAVSFTPLTM